MTDTHPAALQHDNDPYLAALVVLLPQQVRGLRDVAHHDRDDVVVAALEAYAADPEQIRATYPEPAVWGRVKLRSAAYDFARRQGAQRGEGARFGRTVDSFDPQEPTTGGQLVAMSADPADLAATTDLVDELLGLLELDDQRLLYMVKALQFTTRHAARALGITENCACRRLARITRTLREHVTAA